MDFLFPQPEVQDQSFAAVGPAGAETLQRLVVNHEHWGEFLSDFRMRLGASIEQGAILDKVELLLAQAHDHIKRSPTKKTHSNGRALDFSHWACQRAECLLRR